MRKAPGLTADQNLSVAALGFFGSLEIIVAEAGDINKGRPSQPTQGSTSRAFRCRARMTGAETRKSTQDWSLAPRSLKPDGYTRLEDKGLIEPLSPKRQMFRVTHTGHQAAER